MNISIVTRSITGILALLFAGSIMASTATKDMNMNMCHHKCECAIMHMEKELNLTAEQKTKAQAIRTQMRSTVMKNRKELRDVHHQIKMLVNSGKMDDKELNTLIDKKADLIKDNMKARWTARHEFYMMLTPAQQVEFHKLMKKWEAKMSMHKKEMHKKMMHHEEMMKKDMH